MQKNFKILTFIKICLCIFFLNANAASLVQKDYKTHLRWSVSTSKKQLNISQEGTNLTIKTLNKDLFEQIRKDLVTMSTQANYIKSFDFDSKGLPYNPAVITVELKDISVELFSFYQDSKKKHVVDFWINKDLAQKEVTAKNKNNKSTFKKTAKKKTKKKSRVKKVAIKKIKRVTPKYISHMDFRYGSSFIWDYKASIPDLKKDVNIKTKAPNYFYTVKDRVLTEDKKEAHMQLSINFYKKSQWGFMTKSIGIYTKKYGIDENKDLNDFMKSVALIKNLHNPKIKIDDITKKGTFQAAINLVSGIAERTNDPKLRKAITRYILQVAFDKKDYMKSLQIAKKLYVSSTEDFDDEMIRHSSKAILTSLAHLKQLNKINEFLENKTVQRVLPKQTGLAFTSFVNLALGQEEKVIKEFEKREKGIVGTPAPTILFNVAESYFRTAQYGKAIRLFDQYVSHYSFLKNSSHSRLRIALSYDLLNKDFKKTANLYEMAINKSSNSKIRYEAKVRYVGFNIIRKKVTTDEDNEKVIYLDQTADEAKSVSKKLQRLLWLTRLRIFIKDKKYGDAVAYLSTIPLDSLPKMIRDTFAADGAEAVFGLIKNSYLDQNYAKGIKSWEVYKEVYKDSILKNSYLKYIVTDSYLKLGLKRSFEASLTDLKSMKSSDTKKFPDWVRGHKNSDIVSYIRDLELSRLVINKKWEELNKVLSKSEYKKVGNYNFYKGIVSHKLGLYNKSIEAFEKLLVDQKSTSRLSPQENQDMLRSYLESLYEVGSSKKFRKNAIAISGDLKRSEKQSELSERIDYLIIESLFSDQRVSNELVFKVNDFLSAFKKSSYKPRITYIKGVSLLNNKKEKEGKEILSKLLQEKDTPEYLKGLARSELTTLVLKNKQL